MPGQTCYICKHTKAAHPGVSMHRLPFDRSRRQLWIEALEIGDDLPSDVRIRSRHFPDGDASQTPSLTLKKRFASPMKRFGPHCKVLEKNYLIRKGKIYHIIKAQFPILQLPL